MVALLDISPILVLIWLIAVIIVLFVLGTVLFILGEDKWRSK
jgi:hypothetical protein